jgi:hypothetical protein
MAMGHVTGSQDENTASEYHVCHLQHLPSSRKVQQVSCKKTCILKAQLHFNWWIEYITQGNIHSKLCIQYLSLFEREYSIININQNAILVGRGWEDHKFEANLRYIVRPCLY